MTMPNSLRTSVLRVAVALGVAAAAGAPAFAADAPTAGTPPTAQQLAGKRAELDQAYGELEKVARAVPRESFDPAAVTEAVGRDEAALLKWVRENIAWLPYRGVLKGPTGAMLDRGGSSADRAVLLADLLRDAGFEVRLARAALADDQAKALLAGVTAGNGAAPAGGIKPATEAELKRVAAHAAALEALAGLNGPAAASATDADRLAAAKDHWWVQRKDGEAWVDVDVTGTTGVKAEETFPYAGGDGRIVLPAAHVHEVEIGLVIEAWEAGKLVEKPVTSATVRPAEMAGRRLTVAHGPVNAPARPKTNDDPDVRATAAAMTEWLPVLGVADRWAGKRSFDDAGQINESPNLSGAAQIAQQTGKLTGGFAGGLTGGGGGDPAKSDGVLTAEWMDVQVRAPGRPARKIRREVFDLIGPAARAAGSVARPQLTDAQKLDRALILAGRIDVVALAANHSHDFVRHTLFRNALADRRTWLAMLAEKDPARRQNMVGTLHPDNPADWYGFARQSLSPVRGRVYLDAANLVSCTTRLRAADGDKLVVRRVIDVIANDVAVRPGAAGDAATAAVVRLRQGVADTVAEDVVLKDDGGFDAIENTTRLLDARPNGGKLVRVGSAAELAAANLAVPADAKARVAADLARGYAVVLPDQPVAVAGAARTGWWRVHPATGEAVGVMDNGYHADTAEYVVEDTYISGTQISNSRMVGNAKSSFWKRDPRRVARDLGADPEDLDILGKICDIQADLIFLGW